MNASKKMFDKEHVLDAEQWRVEAQAVIDDIRYHVHDIKICDESILTGSSQSIYLNITTLEHLKFCICLSPRGFSIVSKEHNHVNNTNDADGTSVEYFETIYALLDSVSPQYRNSFGKSLQDKLKQLSDSQNK